MAWVVDTCLLLDVGLDDPSFGVKSETLLSEKSAQGLVVCPVTFVELGPAFAGDLAALRKFLFGLSVDFDEPWILKDTENAAKGWAKHILRRRERRGVVPRRPVADALIGAFALRFDGLLTRNVADFRRLYPRLRLIISPV
jgi:predicted nucleic acid-binding protein